MQPTWQILPDAFTEDVYSSQDVEHLPETGRSIQVAFSGRGILYPFRRSRNGGFEYGEGKALFNSAIALVLGTTCSSEISHGELPWRTDFGSLLHMLRLQNLDEGLVELARYYVADALQRWVGGIRVTDTDFKKKATIGKDQDTLEIRVTYNIVDSASARVLIPGIQTAVQIG